MSIEEANKSRFERGLMNLTELEGELLEALESVGKGLVFSGDNGIVVKYTNEEWSAFQELGRDSLAKAYGHD